MGPGRRKVLFVFSLCLASCGYGMMTAWGEIFPFTVVRDATAAAQAYLDVYTLDDRVIEEELSGPTIRKQITEPDNQLFLISGGMNFYSDQSSTGHTLAWIMNRAGEVQHVWEYDPEIWDNLQSISTAPLKSEIFPVGLHLYADGGLLVNFQGKNCWPYGIGLARFDKDGQLLWKKELLNHHWFSVADDGRIYIPNMRMLESPVRIGKTQAEIRAENGFVAEDVVMILDPDGNVLEEISMLEALVDSGWIGLFQGATEDNIHALTDDPTHLNDVRVVSQAIAENHALLNAGDLLVSFRSLNTIGILDRETRRFKWMCSGATIRQHSPRFAGDFILLLDNRGGADSTGGSRLVAIDLLTRAPETVFPRESSGTSPKNFFTSVAGHLDLKPARALVTLTSRSEIQEVDLNSGEVVWEYVYVNPETRERTPVYTAKYVEAVQFPMNRLRTTTP